MARGLPDGPVRPNTLIFDFDVDFDFDFDVDFDRSVVYYYSRTRGDCEEPVGHGGGLARPVQAEPTLP
eukprot:5195157-Heterocapsa_arctica.AAC.1